MKLNLGGLSSEKSSCQNALKSFLLYTSSFPLAVLTIHLLYGSSHDTSKSTRDQLIEARDSSLMLSGSHCCTQMSMTYPFLVAHIMWLPLGRIFIATTQSFTTSSFCSYSLSLSFFPPIPMPLQTVLFSSQSLQILHLPRLLLSLISKNLKNPSEYAAIIKGLNQCIAREVHSSFGTMNQSQNSRSNRFQSLSMPSLPDVPTKQFQSN